MPFLELRNECTTLYAVNLFVNLIFVINLSPFSDITPTTNKTNNLASTHPIKHSVRTHTALRRALAQPTRTEHRASLVQGFCIAQLCLLLSALTREPSPLYWNGHICCSGSEAEIVFRLGLTESDCALGAPNSDVISRCPGIRASP